jgi:hypothetical protein
MYINVWDDASTHRTLIVDVFLLMLLVYYGIIDGCATAITLELMSQSSALMAPWTEDTSVNTEILSTMHRCLIPSLNNS